MGQCDTDNDIGDMKGDLDDSHSYQSGQLVFGFMIVLPNRVIEGPCPTLEEMGPMFRSLCRKG